MAKVAVFPASGKLGTSIATNLFKLLQPESLVLISRYPEKAPSEILEAGVETRKADYDAIESLEGVFDGISTLVLISYPSIQIEHRFNAHKAAIDAARRSGVSYIFYTSLAFGGDCTPNSVAHVMQAHLRTEAYLSSLSKAVEEQPTDNKPPLYSSSSGKAKESKILDNEPPPYDSSTDEGSKDKPLDSEPFFFTVIREGIYSESYPMYTGFPDSVEGRIPHDGKGPGIAFASIADVGEATAKLVVERISVSPFPYNDIVLLSGPTEWTLQNTMGGLSHTLRRDIRVREVTMEEYVRQPIVQEKLGSHGPGDEVPQQWATVYEALRRGECATTSTELGRLLGRKPEPFEETVKSTLNG